MEESGTYCRVELLGNVGHDPLIRYLDERTCMASFSVATDSLLPDSPGGTVTDWHEVVCYRDSAHYVEANVRKGYKVRVTGRLTYKKYRSGEDRYSRKATIIADRVALISKPQPGTSSPYEEEVKSPYRDYKETLSKDAESSLPF
ncbi:single-stranded DNA-binding protein [uncultured Porphyromonas sp.]|uniref:single-stranded DNA-binding protein n=1 Tax=uncultured Porphyromonas sp. TaxID=159274 RepID=UPI00260D62F9|nr:single-stranded DNA-binding protein [uncultured Porphyromonas sp.]